MSIPYQGSKAGVLKHSIQKKTGIKILDIHLKGGIWMALLSNKDNMCPEWEKVSDLLSKPRFNINTEKCEDTGTTSMYLT